jgi:Peptidase propeptide and YPEB domain
VAQGQKGLTARLTADHAGRRISAGDGSVLEHRTAGGGLVQSSSTGRPAEGPVQSSFTAVRVPFAMKMRLIPFALVLAVANLLAVAAPAVRAAEGQRPFAVAAASVSMEQAVKMAEQRFKARVVRAETQHDDGHIVYVLRMLNESGRVWTVRVDASNGALL